MRKTRSQSRILMLAAMLVFTAAALFAFPRTVLAVTYYDLWVGSTQVTSDNKDHISVIGGTAYYDPMDHILHFEGNVTGVDGLYDTGDGKAQIYFGQNLSNPIITGNVKLESTGADYGIYVKEVSVGNNLTLSGEITAFGKMAGIYHTKGAMNVKGKVTARSDQTGVKADILNISGSLDATAEKNVGPTGVEASSVNIKGGSLKAAFDDGDGSGVKINSSGHIVVDGGTFSSKVNGGLSCAVSDVANILVENGGNVALTVSGPQSRALTMVSTSSAILIRDGDFNVSASDNTWTVYPLISCGPLTLRKGSLTVQTDEGCRADAISAGDVTVSDGSFSVSTGGDNALTVRDFKITGGKAEIIAKEKAVIASDEIFLDGGRIHAEGGTKALSSGGTNTFFLGEEMSINEPVGGKINDAKNGIWDADDNPAKKVITEGPDLYDLWVGDVRVSSKNKDHIPGIIGGSAAFDPQTGVLTFTGDVTQITGKTQFDLSAYAKIYSELPSLTIAGKADLTSSDATESIAYRGQDEMGELILAGDLTLGGSMGGFWVKHVGDVRTTITGCVKANGKTTSAVEAGNIRICRGGDLTASIKADYDDASAMMLNNLVVDGGKLTAFAQGKGAKAIETDRMDIYDGQVNATASGTECRTILAKSGFIVTDGTVEAKASGQKSTAIYATTGTSGWILMEGGTALAEVTDNTDFSYAVVTSGLEVEGGSLTVKSSTDGMAVNGGNTDISGGNIQVTAAGSIGLAADEIRMEAGKLQVSGKDTGISFTGNGLNFSGGSLQADGQSGAFYMDSSSAVIVLSGDSKIADPADGVIATDHKSILSSGVPAKSVRLTGTECYPLWIGTNQVTGKNKDDIPGIKGGSAKYDPEKQTLTFFGNVTGIEGYHQSAAGKSLILSSARLTLAGTAYLESGEMGIMQMMNNGGTTLTVEGDISVLSQKCALKSSGGIRINGKLYAASMKEEAIGYGTVIVEEGSLTAETESKADPAIYSHGSLIVREGYVKAKGGKTAISIGNEEGGMVLERAQVTTPENGLFSAALKTITDGAGQPASLVVIDPIHTYFSVAFDVCGHGTAPVALSIKKGDKVQKPTDPEAEGFVFGGWFTDKAYSIAYDFDAPVTADITLYAKWTDAPAQGPGTQDPGGSDPGVSDPSTEADPSWIEDTKTRVYYRILSDEKKTAAFVRPKTADKKKVTVPATITLNGNKYKVVQIDPGAFKSNEKLTKVTIGKNVTKIEQEAFMGCRKLKTIIVKTKKLKKKSVGKNAFKNIHKKAKAKVPAKKVTLYRKTFKKAGMKKKTQKIVK